MKKARIERGDGNVKSKNTESGSGKSQEPGTMLPLIITLIGIFCYLGVILPSVFDSQSTMFNYTAFDITLLLGGAALVGLGAYFWFTARGRDVKKTVKSA